MKERASSGVSFSPIVVVAALSIVTLLAVSAWQATNYWRGDQSRVAESVDITVPEYVSDKSTFDWQKTIEGATVETASQANDPDGLSNIGKNVLGTLVGSYVALKDAGTYTPEQGEGMATTIASDLRADVSYEVYDANDFTHDADTSFPRMLTYRADMRVALEPLLRDSTYELAIFAYYLDTNDSSYLTRLEGRARDYSAAAKNLLKVDVPQDAVAYHAGVLNALSQFEATLVRMSEHADDTFASAALLRTFNDAEKHMLVSFGELANYYKQHPQT